MEVKVIRSSNRKKTISAKLVGQTLQVHLPLGMKPEEERKLIEKMKEKMDKKLHKKHINNDDYLLTKFNEFNLQYFQGKLKVNSLEFVTNQTRVNGSCTPNKCTIRLSHKFQ